MKKIFLLFFCLVVGSLVAQNSNLASKKWFVEALMLEGANVNLTTDHFNFPFVYIDFLGSDTGLMSTSNEQMKTDCSSGFTAHINYNNQNSNTSFSFTDVTLFETISGCSSQDNNMLTFMNAYKSFFIDHQTGVFNYFIQDVYGIEHVRIENEVGDVLWLQEIYNIVVEDDISSKDWILTELILDNISYASPDFQEEGFTNINLHLFNYYTENIATGVNTIPVESTFVFDGCNYNQAMLDLYPTQNAFYLYDLGGTLSDCGNTVLNTFSYQHYDFYANNLPGAFAYAITNLDNLETLIITNPIGNQAIYQREVLSIDSISIFSLDVYPNPVTNFVYVKTSGKIEKIELFSILGKEILKTNQTKIDIQSLGKGVYFLRVSLADKQVFVRKIYKTD